MERLTNESFDLVVFDGCQEESGRASDAYVLNHLRELAHKSEFVLVECSNVGAVDGFDVEDIFSDSNSLNRLYSGPLDVHGKNEFPSGNILKWYKDFLPSFEEVRQSLFQTLLRIRPSPGTSDDKPAATATPTKIKLCDEESITTATTNLHELNLIAAQQAAAQWEQCTSAVDNDTTLRKFLMLDS